MFLKPIHKVIQRKLFQKQKLLGREGNTPNTPVSLGGLSHDKLAVRSTFIRMSSGLNKPVILMSGELKDDGSIAGGYDEIYGKRGDSDNKFRRPMPGIKSIDVSFLGGDKALREGTINWTCWSFDEIERLTPHFLSVGKTVAVEWGWVYGNDTNRIRGFIDKNGIKFNNVYRGYREVVNTAEGDIDMMVGIIKNFEFTTRADGGFDCTTKISSVGSDLLKRPVPSKGATNMALRIDKSAKSSKDVIEAQEALRTARGEIDTDGTTIDQPDLTIKSIIQELDTFLAYQLSLTNLPADIQISKDVKRKLAGNPDATDPTGVNRQKARATKRFFVWKENSFIISYQGRTFDNLKPETIFDVWVRWGWFEDNILSKFESIVSKNNIIKSEFRSVDRDEDEKGKLLRYKPTLIRNHKYLETVNLDKYILPGKLKPLNEKTAIVRGKTDGLYINSMAEIVNDEENFPSFNTEDESKGVFRNMLINTKVLREAFGVGGEYSVSSLSTFEAITRMFSSLNEDIGFWDFQIRADEVDTYRSKIVDAFVTDKKFPQIGKFTRSSPDTLSKSVYNFASDIFINHGIYYFPVWQHDSLVKSQNLNCSIPNEVAISVMYGANAPKINTLGATESEANDEGAQLAGGIGKDKNDAGDLEDLQIVLQKGFFYRNYGVKQNDEYEINTTQGSASSLIQKGDRLSPNIVRYLSDNQVTDRLDKREKELKKDKDEMEKAAISARVETRLDELISTNIPPPIPSKLTASEKNQLFYDDYVGTELNGIKIPRNSFTQLYFSKFTEKRMKQEFIDSIAYNTTYLTSKITKSPDASELDKPILIPISLELEIDGIGGIFPFECFHSTYLPKRYQDEALFQIFSVNHTVNSSTWTTTIGGKMRSNIKKIYEGEIIPKELESVEEQFHKAKSASNAKDLKERIFKERKDGGRLSSEQVDKAKKQFDKYQRSQDALNEDVFTDEELEEMSG